MNLQMLPLALLLLTACGSSDTNGVQNTSALPPTGPQQAGASKLTAVYLEGAWCYTHHVAGKDRSDENLSYVFSTDGSLLYQVNSTASIDKPGRYTITNGHLKIIPTLRFFDFTVDTIEPDAMVLKMAYGKAYWHRGTCHN